MYIIIIKIILYWFIFRIFILLSLDEEVIKTIIVDYILVYKFIIKKNNWYEINELTPDELYLELKGVKYLNKEDLKISIMDILKKRKVCKLEDWEYANSTYFDITKKYITKIMDVTQEYVILGFNVIQEYVNLFIYVTDEYICMDNILLLGSSAVTVMWLYKIIFISHNNSLIYDLTQLINLTQLLKRFNIKYFINNNIDLEIINKYRIKFKNNLFKINNIQFNINLNSIDPKFIKIIKNKDMEISKSIEELNKIIKENAIELENNNTIIIKILEKQIELTNELNMELNLKRKEIYKEGIEKSNEFLNEYMIKNELLLRNMENEIEFISQLNIESDLILMEHIKELEEIIRPNLLTIKEILEIIL